MDKAAKVELPGSVADGLCGAVGHTPLIRLRHVSEETGCNILAKAEFMNPGGSVKDRAAYFIIKDAEDKGLLKPGGTVVEGTAGNTGIGMAHICNSKGYKLVIYMPDNQSKEKINLLKTLGATVHCVPVVPFTNPDNYNHQARRYAESHENHIWGNQFDNTANKLGHYVTTGPEIWDQTEGKVHGWTVSTGTGGTYAGVAEFLKQKNPDIKCYVADPPGSVLYEFFQSGKLERTGTGSITEGIGQGRITDNLKGAPVDGSLHISDKDSVHMLFRLIHEEGIFCGASSALNVCAAVELAKKLGPGHNIVTVLCDGAMRYQSRLLNKDWLKTKGLFDDLPKHFTDLLD
eukprot:TRINITY_DN1085_c0_g1_i2.p1 TRINITY_DN1085_c0_g1~~TRINITY_DN1085_c0_g1_i2.p1  ORF type:complete len:365 (-),score=75.49 TRINITY_DN1085_c0_g1_i2:160-1197(-)